MKPFEIFFTWFLEMKIKHLGYYAPASTKARFFNSNESYQNYFFKLFRNTILIPFMTQKLN